MAGAASRAGRRMKFLLIVGYVLKYGRSYEGRSGSHTGGGKSNPFWDIYLKRSEWGIGFRLTRNVAGKCGSRYISGK